MKELFLDMIFATNKLDIIDDLEFKLPIFSAKFKSRSISDRFNQLIRELFTGAKKNLLIRVLVQKLGCNSLGEMRLPHSNTSIKEKRVISSPRSLRYSLGSSIGDLV